MATTELADRLRAQIAAAEASWEPWRSTLMGAITLLHIGLRRLIVDAAAELPGRVGGPMLRWADTWKRIEPPEARFGGERS